MRQVNLTQKNSLIELYRFLFALWVVYYHGYFFVQTGHFNHGYLSVEFFFLLNGFFVERTMRVYRERPLFQGLFSFTWKRLKTLDFTFVVGVIVFVAYRIVFPDSPEEPLFGFLWYIPQMLISFAVVYLITKFIKSQKINAVVLFLVFALSYSLNWTVLDNWGLLRGIGCVSFGAFLAKIPKINLKYKKVNFGAIIAVVIFVATVVCAYLYKTSLIVDYVAICVLFPALIYFSNCVEFSFKPFNHLGAISFGIYIYQIVIRFIHKLKWITNPNYLCLILFALVLIDYTIKLFVNKKAKQKYMLKENLQN